MNKLNLYFNKQLRKSWIRRSMTEGWSQDLWIRLLAIYPNCFPVMARLYLLCVYLVGDICVLVKPKYLRYILQIQSCKNILLKEAKVHKLWWPVGTPTKRQVSKRRVSKRLKRHVYKTSGLQMVRFTKCQVYKTSGPQNVRLQKNIHIFSVLVVGGNSQVLLQPCLQAKWWLCFILYFRGFFAIYHHNK